MTTMPTGTVLRIRDEQIRKVADATLDRFARVDIAGKIVNDRLLIEAVRLARRLREAAEGGGTAEPKRADAISPRRHS